VELDFQHFLPSNQDYLSLKNLKFFPHQIRRTQNINEQYMNIKELTKTYIKAFESKDRDALESLLHEEMQLTDPAGTFRGKVAVLEYILGIWSQFAYLNFEGRHIFVDSPYSVIEFSLALGDKNFVGTDVIEWKEGKIFALRAYLY
jgi:hypothetical protein